MKLLLAIVPAGDADELIDTLLRNDFGVTRIDSSGGFLRQSNVTLLIGVEATQVDRALQLITATCHPHVELEPNKAKLTTRCALVFILSVESCVGV
ncbi:MAG: hypothetical protein FJ014_02165 [Chloroflexi bacterium]|nr:hypothetical protein [Chloroflexota bacterium]